jgi:hypothetical protein
MGRLTGFGLAGERRSETVFDSSDRALVIGISAGCGFCINSIPAWKRIVRAAEALKIRVIWISRETPSETSAFFSTYYGPVTGVVIAEPTYATFDQIKLSRVPQTVLLKAGVVLASWPGLVDAEVEKQIVATLNAFGG